MEENTEGHCDSDVSDGWAIVDYKSEDIVSHLRSSTDSGLSSENLIGSKQASTDNLDECYELTELIDPLAENNVKDKRETCDIDSDGISVISDDEETINWQKNAHDSYANVVKLLETPPRAPDAQPVVEIAPENTSQQTIFHYFRKHLVIASAVAVAITCIALAQLFKTEPTMAEMLEHLEELKIENQKLNSQLQSLTLAYTTLKENLPVLKEKQEPVTESSDNILQFLEKFAQDKDPRIRMLIEKLQNQINQNAKPPGKSLNKQLKRSKPLVKKLPDSEQLVKKPKKKRAEGLKIVQWYPEEADKTQPYEYHVPDIPKPSKRKFKRKFQLKPDCDNRNKTGMWYLERGKGRETSRKTDEQKDWQFAKGRRDLKREDEEKSMWYLRRLELHARTRQ